MAVQVCQFRLPWSYIFLVGICRYLGVERAAVWLTLREYDVDISCRKIGAFLEAFQEVAGTETDATGTGHPSRRRVQYLLRGRVGFPLDEVLLVVREDGEKKPVLEESATMGYGLEVDEIVEYAGHDSPRIMRLGKPYGKPWQACEIELLLKKDDWNWVA